MESGAQHRKLPSTRLLNKMSLRDLAWFQVPVHDPSRMEVHLKAWPTYYVESRAMLFRICFRILGTSSRPFSDVSGSKASSSDTKLASLRLKERSFIGSGH